MGKKNFLKILFREKPIALLLHLKNSKSEEVYASSLAKAIDCTYSHVIKLLQIMEGEGLITFDRQGRLNLLTLTKKGEELTNKIESIKNYLS